MEKLSAGAAELRLGATGGGGAVALGEFIDASCGINETGFTGEERVASGADADLEVLHSGHGSVDRATGATDGGLERSRVDGVFHGMRIHGKLARLKMRTRCFRQSVGVRRLLAIRFGSTGF